MYGVVIYEYMYVYTVQLHVYSTVHVLRTGICSTCRNFCLLRTRLHVDIVPVHLNVGILQVHEITMLDVQYSVGIPSL